MISLLFLSLSFSALAEDFEIKSVIHPAVMAMKKPKVVPGFEVQKMAITTASEEAAEHVNQGMGRLATSSDFEAYRHFVTAAKLDPDCLMAFWGISMSLAGGQHEFFSERNAAVERMIDLVEAGKGSPLEQGYVQATGRLLTEGPQVAGATFDAISEKFPNDLLSKLFGLFLKREGFDSFGSARRGQKLAVEGLTELLKENPENFAVMSFWINTRSETPLIDDRYLEEVVPITRKLVTKLPALPSVQLMLTHVEARAGNLDLAIAAAQKTVKMFEAYMTAEGVSLYDCEGWVRAKVYLGTLYTMVGNFDQGIEVARELASIKVDPDRLFSKGAGLLMWEGRTLSARLAMGRFTPAEFKSGQKLLETLPNEEWFFQKSFAGIYRDNLAFCLGVKLAILNRDKKVAVELYEELLNRIAGNDSKQRIASATSTYGSWLRASRTVATYAAELRGDLAMLEEGAIQRGAVNYYRAATERQQNPTNLLPPSIDYPMELRVGDFLISNGMKEEAIEAYQKGLKARPGHHAVLSGLQKAEGK